MPAPSPQVSLFQSLLATIDHHAKKQREAEKSLRDTVERAVKSLAASPATPGQPAAATAEQIVEFSSANGVETFRFEGGETWTHDTRTHAWTKL